MTSPVSLIKSMPDLSEYDFEECRCRDMSLPADTPCSMEWHPAEKALYALRDAVQHAQLVRKYRDMLRWGIEQGGFHPSRDDGAIIQQIYDDTYSWEAGERAMRRKAREARQEQGADDER